MTQPSIQLWSSRFKFISLAKSYIYKGTKEVLITTNGAEKQRISNLVAINANHQILPLLTIFKGKKVPRDVEHLENDQLVLYANQNFWMSEEAFLF